MAAWAYLIVSLWGAWFTWNAHFPRRTTSLRVPSFFAGWLTAELAVHHILWQAIATVVFVRFRALDRWPGILGLVVTVASWIGLAGLVATSRRTEDIVEDAVTTGLGSDFRRDVHPDIAEALRKHGPKRNALPFLLTDPEVEVERNIRYAEGAGRRHLLDVYRPRAGTEKAPVLLQVHGGAWMIGDKAQQALPLMNHLTARGWVCVSTNYRLSPKATFPDHIVDLKLAMKWIRENIADHGGDPDFIVVTGGSAGGHLSSLLALTANDPELQPGFEDVDTSVRACVPFYGIYDFTNSNGIHDDATFEQFLEATVMKSSLSDDKETWVKASPIFRVSADAPPFLVIHGTHDSLAPVGEAQHFVAALEQVSTQPVAYAELPGAQHAFEVFHSQRTGHVIRGVSDFLGWVRSRYVEGREARVVTTS